MTGQLILEMRRQILIPQRSLRKRFSFCGKLVSFATNAKTLIMMTWRLRKVQRARYSTQPAFHWSHKYIYIVCGQWWFGLVQGLAKQEWTTLLLRSAGTCRQGLVRPIRLC